MKYKFRMSESTFIELTEEEIKNFKGVDYIDDNSEGVIIPVKRTDNQIFHLIVPIDMLEESEGE